MEIKQVKLNDLCLKITDGSHYSPKQVNDGVPIYSVKDMTAYGFSDDSVKRISESDFEKLLKADCFPKTGDVLIAKDGSVMKHVFCVEKETRSVVLSSIAILRPNPMLINSDYLSYALQNPSLKAEILSNYVSGSGVPRIILRDFKNIKMPVPELRFQKSIATVLKTIEKKIQLNNELSSNLEILCQTIFKSWFIDFDPVLSKIEGKQPEGMDAETAKLFPDSKADSQNGMIPKGWVLRTLASLGEVLLGGTPSRKRLEFWGGGLAWINSGKVNEFRISTSSEFITEAGAKSSSTKLLPSGTTVIAITGATLGQYSRLEIDAYANQSVIGIVASEECSDEFIYLTIKNNIARLVALQTGGAQQHINKDDVSGFKCVYPGQEIMEKFTDIVKPIFRQIGLLTHQSRTLESLRDSLLPRLISGELEIPDEMLES